MQQGDFFRSAVRGVAMLLLIGTTGAVEAAEAWGIQGERMVSLRAKVVDLLCELKGDCPAQCGNGRRQLGLLEPDGKLRMVAKGNVDFANGIADLLPFCGKEIEADGLLIENPGVTLFFIQGVRADSSQPFSPTDGFQTDWVARYGPSEEWYRKDPAANAIIAEEGPFGIKGLQPKPKQ